MATVLLAWELGGGLGHLANLLPLARHLSERGHAVVAVLRDLWRATQVFGDVACLQAPIKIRKDGPRIEPVRTFAHLLHNTGFGDFNELWSLTCAWRNLYQYAKPDAVVFDHSPTALLASRGCGVRRILLGAGFFCPLAGAPLPDLRPWLGPPPERLPDDEHHVLENANKALERFGQPPLKQLSDLYHRQVDENLLVTFKELDHYHGRDGSHYWGPPPSFPGGSPRWPEGQGKRVFAYLKPFPALPGLLGTLKRLQCPTLIYGDGIAAGVKRQFDGESLRFVDTALDVEKVGPECDLAILNGNHGTTAAMLLAGKPILQLPLYLEQTLLSSTVVRLGAGLIASPVNDAEIASTLVTLLNLEQHAAAARRFADRYRGFDAQTQAVRLADRVEQLLAAGV